MSEQTYDFEALLNAYIAVRRTNGRYIHPDFERFYESQLVTLEKAFGIIVSESSVSVELRGLWLLFDDTLRSFFETHHPRAGYIEASLINNDLDRLGEQGNEIRKLEGKLWEIIQQAYSVYNILLYRLFVAMYGEHPQTFTSDDLKQWGFDDSTKPDIRDYFDYL